VRRQTEILGAAAPVRAKKLDPARLPLNFTSPDDAADGGERAVTLDADRIVMARRISDVAMKINLPLTAYRGVAIRVLPGASEEHDSFAVVLSHTDPGLEVTLFEAQDDSEIIAEWRKWAATLGLPLVMEGLDGRSVVAATRLGDVEISRPRPRRARSFLKNRRPRFLTRRRAGTPSLVPFVHYGEREIIAQE
jgi:hypothetical protein